MRHFNAEQYHAYAEQMREAVGAKNFCIYKEPLETLWLYRWLEHPGWLDLPPATPASPDRYPTPSHFVRSNIVQHNRTAWLKLAAHFHPDTDVFVWLDYGLLKQGDFTGKRIEPKHIAAFHEKVERYYEAGHTDIPFPGIEPQGPVNIAGNCWRFCGSTHIIPRWHLNAIDVAYRQTCCNFIASTRTVPLDLPIWALVEMKHRELPYRWYKAEYDYTQLENFPCALSS